MTTPEQFDWKKWVADVREHNKSRLPRPSHDVRELCAALEAVAGMVKPEALRATDARYPLVFESPAERGARISGVVLMAIRGKP